jgi:hypothetical protein
MSRLSFGWGRAIHVSVVICSVPGVLSMVMPSGWVTIIPLVSIPFEVCPNLIHNLKLKVLTYATSQFY